MRDTIENILKEKSLIESDYFHVLRDAEPICDDHILILPKVSSPSFADCSINVRLQFHQMLDKYFVDSKYLFFERGRASFCTSFSGSVHAHCHLVKSDFFKEDLLDLLKNDTSAANVNNLESAFQETKSNGEYLVFGQLKGSCFVSYPFAKNVKRYIRKSLIANKNY